MKSKKMIFSAGPKTFYWNHLKFPLSSYKKIGLFLDFDGTLSKIVPHPDKAVFAPDMKAAVKKLARCPRIKLAIISGRSLKSVKKKVGIKNIFYAGSHGLEISGPGFSWELAEIKNFKKVLRRIVKSLQGLKKIRGVFIEDKKITLSVHFRRTPKPLLSRLEKDFKKALKPFIDKHQAKITYGKKIFEVRPPVLWGKGEAILFLIKKLQLSQSLNIFVGDDVTDEDAFRVLKGKNFGIRVGAFEKSKARYVLKNIEEVRKFLVQTFSLCNF